MKQPELDDICRDCKHEYQRHYEDFGGLEGCGQGTRNTLPGGNQFDYDVYVSKCLCEGFAVGLTKLVR